PDLLREGLSSAVEWDAALRTLERCDPRRVFSSPLLDRLMGCWAEGLTRRAARRIVAGR
ncbi:cholesterol oxidase substrate-binding domain-containing protein, partial [Burkholderia pseudomallei]